MSKKIMLLALAVVSAAVFALPAAASAQEAHISGVTTFTGSGPAGTLTTSGEPTVSCTTNTVSKGSFNAGSTTTGEITLDFTGCTAEFFGIKGSCNTSGAAAGTISSGGTFHIITISSGKPGILVTPVPTTIICLGFSNITTGGNVIGTITSPACGASSKTITTSFKSTGATQEHASYTGAAQTLTAKTGSGVANPAGLNAGTVTLTSSTAGTLECT
jgi:hypothetical protein